MKIYSATKALVGGGPTHKWESLKRGFDLFVGSAVLVLLTPVMGVTAAAIRLDTSGPVIFRQERLGLHGRPFTMYKFRTMHQGAESGGVYEAPRDLRVTRVGRILRATSIDELPQLVNVIRGEMSIIGPRPTLTYHPWAFEDYSDAQRARFDVRPGLTGLAQVSGRKNVDWHRRIELDIEYVKTMSPLVDLEILLRTFLTVFAMRDNVNLSETASGLESGLDSGGK